MTGAAPEAPAAEIAALLRLREIERFLFREARLLDEGRFEDWLELFTEDAVYWVPAEPGQESPLDRLSLFYEDKSLLALRVRQIRHPRFHARAAPPRTRRVVGNVTVDEDGGAAGETGVRSSFVMVEHCDDRRRVFAGETAHRLRREESGFRIAAKRVDLVDCDGTHGFISAPF